MLESNVINPDIKVKYKLKNGAINVVSDPLIAFKKKNWPSKKHKPTLTKKNTCTKSGNWKTKITGIVPIIVAIKLLIKRIWGKFSRPDNIFMQIISKPIIMAPSKQNAATGLKPKLLVGLIKRIAPENVIKVANPL